MRTLLLAACLVFAGQTAAASCEGPRPWKSPDAVQYSAELRVFYGLADQTSSAYSRGDTATAKRLAQEYLSAAPRFPCDWNYGNAVHNANAVLGLIALQEGHRRTLFATCRGWSVARINSTHSVPRCFKLSVWPRPASSKGSLPTCSIRRFWEADDTTILGFVGFRDPQPMSLGSRNGVSQSARFRHERPEGAVTPNVHRANSQRMSHVGAMEPPARLTLPFPR